MLRHVAAIAVVGLGWTLAACGTAAPSEPSRYKLTAGSTISISTTTEGANTIVVTIPPGSPGAGEHVSTADALVEAARSAKNRLNEPGIAIEIDVDASGGLTAIGQTVTK